MPPNEAKIMYVHIELYMYILMYTHIDTYLYVVPGFVGPVQILYTYTHIHVHIHIIHIYTYAYTYYTHMYIYIYIFFSTIVYLVVLVEEVEGGAADAVLAEHRGV